jgi:hypothetical protein
MTSRARIAIIAAALVVLVVAYAIASGSGGTSDSKDRGASAATSTAPAAGTTATSAGSAPAPATTTTPAAPSLPVIRVVDAKPQGGVKRLKFTKGDTIAFEVQSDTADEIHVHGYDVHKDVKAGGSVAFSIPAKIEGRFVVELENHGTQIAELEVDPS